MTDAAREARNRYRRDWAARNKDKVAEQQRRYWEKQAELYIHAKTGTDHDNTRGDDD